MGCNLGTQKLINNAIKGNKAKVFGKSKLNGAELMATDLRASVSLVLAGLVSTKKTIINRIYHLDRGYEQLEKKLSKCGATIKRLKWLEIKINHSLLSSFLGSFPLNI